MSLSFCSNQWQSRALLGLSTGVIFVQQAAYFSAGTANNKIRTESDWIVDLGKNVCRAFRKLLNGRRPFAGCVMNSGIAACHLPDEHFVLQIDGRVKSGHRRFIDALRAALRLKQEFPQHGIKVRASSPRTTEAVH